MKSNMLFKRKVVSPCGPAIFLTSLVQIVGDSSRYVVIVARLKKRPVEVETIVKTS